MSRSLGLLICAFLILLSPAAQSQSVQDPEGMKDLREKAELAYSERDAATALKLYSALTEAYPNDPDAWLGLSFAHEWSDGIEEAIFAAERVQQLGYFSQASLSYRLSRLNALAGHREFALQWLRTALASRYEDRPEIQSDEAFSDLLDDPDFRALAGMLPGGAVSRDEGLKFDLRYLVEEARRMHAAPDRPAYGEEFQSAAQELESAIPELTDAEFFLGAMKLLAILNDGHTAIYGPGPDSPLQINGKVLPLKFYWFADGVFIVDGTGSNSEFAGSRVIRIGDRAVEEVLTDMSTFRGVDNAQTWKWMGPQFYVGQLQMLQLIGASDDADSAQLTLEGADGQITEQRFEGGFERAQRKLRPSPVARGDVPMYLENIDANYWMRSMPAYDAVYFQFNQVRDADDQSIAQFADALLERLSDDDASTLIVDVRHNNGGNNGLVRPLIRAMVAYEQAADDNEIYIITGRNTFSAAQNFITRAEQWTDAVFVGEPSASSPNFTGEETNLMLPYSKVVGSISTRYWQDSNPGDQRAWIVPAIPVEPTASDFFEGKDAALDAILRQISN
jgi:hypothetical protein